ncbi:hypothetical protein BMJ34_11155 [Sinorhizobium medicae]|uniref:Uncharacterized protein n=1 Tax=Sinorhizobium medicae TaxID=110321 RepID=A0ABX4TSI8_9HYPH|nr:hypothetical protein BMJ34_11155 [Sinorhizobium medicae]PLU08537.1 hypothetical protein BMJ33_02735 [Sinorhizobium medicae]PLU13496.1 hypothetical protein BMJ29_29705 [Sinorhizobium medicae]PLU16664.1 hypothetical protein BMJ30_16915 [Sinorhizobium medicae]PLU33554.1 hypothetical protein BMJ27_16365 [Sinorhizobium medicae]
MSIFKSWSCSDHFGKSSVKPSLGDYVYFSALDFFEEFEREAAFIVNSDLQWDLRWQVLSF